MKRATKQVIKAECEDCLCSGVFVPPDQHKTLKGLGIVCRSCDGRGWVRVEFRRFKKRRMRRGILAVKTRALSPNPGSWPYKTFLETFKS
jgi:hypothetical protein